jgi:ABC-type transport system involved in multi-copper enzyme maturation permease subunit
MRIVIVGQKNGKAVVCWSKYLALTLVLSLVMGAGVGFVYYMLSGQWSYGATVYGAMIGFGMPGLALMCGLKTAPDKLTPL